jgi:hypothetical protein
VEFIGQFADVGMGYAFPDLGRYTITLEARTAQQVDPQLSLSGALVILDNRLIGNTRTMTVETLRLGPWSVDTFLQREELDGPELAGDVKLTVCRV